MTPVRVNTRFRGRPVTGVERFAGEVTARLGARGDLTLSESHPDKPLAGLKGHAWEQFVLPRRTSRGEVLFSPCNTGPVSVRNQFVVIHDAAVWDHPEGFSRSFRTVYQHLLPRLAKRAAVVATVSRFSRDRLAAPLGLPAESILVLGNAAGPSFTPGEPNTVDPGNEEGPVLLCVGSMDPRKNLGRLLRAWLSLQSAGRLPENARLQIAGGANPRNFAAVDRLEGHGIEWLGRIDDAELVRRYRAADAFVFPSLYEGFGLPPLEAMACGCPVLLSRAASLPEVGGSEEEGAVRYFDPESESEIAAAIEGFLSLPPAFRDGMRRRALARAARFSWDDIAGRIADGIAGIV
jgi:glycosyltransferase involved in cell wall biosynthesis